MLFKRPVLLFFTLVSSLMLAALGLIQSPQFADIVKGRLATYVPSGLGLNGDFSEFEINLFPPGISITNPRLSLDENNALGLPADSDIVSERLDLNFYPLQMLTGEIRVSEIVLASGSIRFEVDAEQLTAKRLPKKKETKSEEFRWDQLFKVKTESVVFQNTTFELKVNRPDFFVRFKANDLRLGQWYGRGGLGYRLELSIEDVFVESKKVEIPPNLIQALQLDIAINPQGIDLKKLKLVGQETNIAVTAELEGNILELDDLPFEATAMGNARLESLPLPAKIKKKLSRALRGKVAFEAEGSGRTGDLFSTLEVDLEVTGKDLSVEGWDVSEFILDASWEAREGLKYGYVELNRFEARSNIRPRAPGVLARGGALVIEPFKGPIDLRSKPPKLVAKLRNAHVQWLLGPMGEKLYGLQIAPSGRLEFDFEPGNGNSDDWHLTGTGELSADRVVYDTGKLEEPNKKPLLVVEGKAIKIPLAVELDSKGIRFDQTQVQLPNTKFAMQGGIDFEKGIDMVWDGPVNLDDIPVIAGSEILGEGTIKTTLTGMGKNILLGFDIDLAETRYLNLALGKLKGKVIYDDLAEEFRFEELEGRYIGTTYVGNGAISLKGDTDTIAMTVDVKKGQIENLLDVFESFHRKLWWFPRTLVGPVRGRIDIKGGLKIEEMTIMGDLSGRDWDYWREKFVSVRLTGGYSRGKFLISRLDARKSQSLIKATVGFDEKTELLSWSLRSERLMVRDIDRISRLDVPVEGFLTIYSEGSGKLDALVSRTDIGIYDFSIRGNQFPDAKIRADLESDRLRVKGTADEKIVALNLEYPFAPGEPATVRASLNHFDFSPLILILNSDLARDSRMKGLISGDVDLAFTSGNLFRSTGSIDLRELSLKKKGFGATIEKPLSFKLLNGNFSEASTSIKFDRFESLLKVSLASKKRRLSGTVRGPVDIGLVEFFTTSVERRAGSMELNLRLDGPTDDPFAKGGIIFKDGEIRISGLDAPIQRIRGLAEIQKGRIRIEKLEGEMGGGSVVASGDISLKGASPPNLDLNVNFGGSRLKIFPFQVSQVSGRLALRGEELPYLVKGDVELKDGLIKEPFLSGSSSGSSGGRTALYTPPSTAANEAERALFQLDIKARSRENVRIRNDLFDGEILANVRVINTLDNPHVMGSAQLLNGEMSVNQKRFVVESAKVTFDHPTVFNPKFSLAASTEFPEAKVKIFASGSIKEPKIEFSSEPSLEQGQIRSLLGLGLNPEQLAQMSASERERTQQSQGINLIFNALTQDLNRKALDRWGVEIQLDEADGVQERVGQSKLRPQVEAADAGGGAPKLIVKKKIGDNFDISAGSTVPGAEGGAQEQEINAEIQLPKGFSVRGVYNNVQGVNSSVNPTSQSQQSFGIDLKFRKRFK